MHTGCTQPHYRQGLKERSGVRFLAAAATAGTHRVALDNVPHLIVSVEQRHWTERDKMHGKTYKPAPFFWCFLKECFIDLLYPAA